MARGQLKQHVLVPATPFDAWRLRHFPRWAIRAWPIRYREVETYTVEGLADLMKRTWSAERLEQLRAMENPVRRHTWEQLRQDPDLGRRR